MGLRSATPALALLGFLSSCGQAQEERPWVVTRSEAASARASTANVSRPVGEARTIALPNSISSGAFVEWELGPAISSESDPQLELSRKGEQAALPAESLPAADEPDGWRRFRAALPAEAAGASLVWSTATGEVLRSAPRVHARRDEVSRPSLVWIVIDTLRADYLGCYGHDRPTSPRIDELAAEGVVFEHAISPASWTLPAMASMLTGLYGEGHGLLHTEHRLAPDQLSFVEVLAGSGYTTGAVVSGTFTDSFWGFDQGFDEYDDLGMVVDDRSGGATTIEAMKERAHRRVTSTEVSDRALDFVRRQAGRRFFLLAHYFDPHQDFVEHAGLSERFEPRGSAAPAFGLRDPDPEATALLRGLYEGEIAFTDRHVGRLLDGLEELSGDEEVVIVLTSDHGEEFYERQWLGHGNTLFNEVLRVPLVLRVPGASPGRVRDSVTTLDVAPTLLELAGLGDAFGEGRSLLPWLRGESGGEAREVFASLYPSFAPETGETAAEVAIRVDSGREAAVRDSRLPAPLLFDCGEDPLQIEDLGRERAERLRILLERYELARARLVAPRSSPERLDLSPEVLEALRGLGYAGEDE